MPTNSTVQLPAPQSWEEFEIICADLFSRVYNDRNAVRHGKQGQRQNGVDICVNTLQGPIGIQCKEKENFPPKILKNSDIDSEIEKAKQYKPCLSEFVIATTAPPDTDNQEHTRIISEEHKKQKLFSVHVWDWHKIKLELATYQDLLRKHYPQIFSAELPCGQEHIDNAITERLLQLKKCRWSLELNHAEEVIKLSQKIIHGDMVGGSSTKKIHALAWCIKLLPSDNVESIKAIFEEIKRLDPNYKTRILQAFSLAAEKQFDAAISLLKEENSLEGVTAAFFIVANQKESKAITWLSRIGKNFSDIDPDGKYLYLSLCIAAANWDDALKHAGAISENDFQEQPFLLWLVAIIHLALVIHPDFRKLIIVQIPLDAANFPLGSSTADLLNLSEAQSFFNRYQKIVRDMGLTKTANAASDFVLWLKLRNPEYHAAALKELNESMRFSEHSLRRSTLATQFGLTIDVDAIHQEIDRRSAWGASDADAEISWARYAVGMSRKTAGEAADYLIKYFAEIIVNIDEEAIAKIIIELLYQADRKEEAQLRLAELVEKGIDDTVLSKLKALGETSKNVDRAKPWIDAYEKSQALNDLLCLCEVLIENSDFQRLCYYAKTLFSQDRSLKSMVRYAKALNRLEKYDELNLLLDTNEDIRSQSDELKYLWGWELLRAGRFAECKVLLHNLKSNSNLISTELQKGLALVTGQWGLFSNILEEEFEHRNSLNSTTLLRNAELAQRIGSSRTRDFAFAAVTQQSQNPRILLDAYQIAVRGGWEGELSATDNWLQQAIDLSSEEGPIRSIDIKEYFANSKWESREKRIWDALKEGESPIYLVAEQLNRSLSDLFLTPAIANSKESNIQKKFNIWAYSEARPFFCEKNISTIGIDITALLTMMQLDLIPLLLHTFSKVIIPFDTMEWLFHEISNSRFHQPSRVIEARAIMRMIEQEQLKSFTCTEPLDSRLLQVAGVQFASFVAMAEAGNQKQKNQHFAVCSFPIYRIDSFLKEFVDIKDYDSILCSVIAIINKLKIEGELTEQEEELVDKYFAIHKVSKENEPIIEDGAILYMDEVSIGYIFHLGLLSKLHRLNVTIYVQASAFIPLLHYDHLKEETRSCLTNLQKILADGIAAEKIIVTPIIYRKNKDIQTLYKHPVAGILGMSNTDIVICDDRFMNRQGMLSMGNQIEIPIMTTFDLLNHLRKLEAFSERKLFSFRTKLRELGYLFVPVDKNELSYYLKKAKIKQNLLCETTELRTIRGSLLQARMSEAITVNKEHNWLYNVTRAIQETLLSEWIAPYNFAEARARSNWLFALLDWRGWCYNYQGKEQQITQLRYLPIIALFRQTHEKNSSKHSPEYNFWIKQEILPKLKAEAPFAFKEIIEHIKTCLEQIALDSEKQFGTIGDKDTSKSTYMGMGLSTFVESIRNEICQDTVFLKKWNISTESIISIRCVNGTFHQDEFFATVRNIIGSSSMANIYDVDKQLWTISSNASNEIFIERDSQKICLHNLSALIPCIGERIRTCSCLAQEAHIPFEPWLTPLSEAKVDEDTVIAFARDLEATPYSLLQPSNEIGIEIPDIEIYYERLIGSCKKSINFSEYISSEGLMHIQKLLAWNSRLGLKIALMMSYHNAIATNIDLNLIPQADQLAVLQEIASGKNIIPKIGLLELLIPKVSDWPEIEPELIKIVSSILDDSPDNIESEFYILSALIIHVEGQLSNYMLFRDKPPFWRRFASISHAVLLRSIQEDKGISADILNDHLRTEQHEIRFQLQALCDLRFEQSWFAGFLSPNLLKAEILRRLHEITMRYSDILNKCSLLQEAFRKGGLLASDFLDAHFPGILVPNSLTGKYAIPLSKKNLDIVFEHLSDENISYQSFISFVTVSLVHEMPPECISQTIDALKRFSQISLDDESEYIILMELLAWSAATCHSPELAQELLSTIDRMNIQYRRNIIPVHELFSIIMIAAAAHTSFGEWQDFIRDRLSKIVYGNLSSKDAEMLHYNVKTICQVVPELWPKLGKLEAALSAIIIPTTNFR